MPVSTEETGETMAVAEDAGAEAPQPKKSKLPFLIGVVLMLLLGGGGFYAVYSGKVLPHAAKEDAASGHDAHEADPLPDIAYVPLEPLTISLKDAGARHLRFVAQLEVPKAYEADVEHLKPRVMDVLNGYLRAVDVHLLEEPTAMMRLRAQMLRRIRLVAGDGRVRDLLIIEFVLN